MSWYYNSVSGIVSEVTGPAKWVKDREIFLERHDPIPGQINWGPFATEEEALAFKTTHPATGVVADIHEAAHTVTNTNIRELVEAYAIRVAEFTVGLIILAIAVNALIRQTTGVDVAGTAKGVAKKTVKTAASVTGAGAAKGAAKGVAKKTVKPATSAAV